MWRDPDRHFSIQPLEKMEQLIGGKAAVMSVHQMGYVRLRDAQYRADFSLLKIFVFDNSMNTKRGTGWFPLNEVDV